MILNIENKKDLLYYLTMILLSLLLFCNFKTGSDIIALLVTFGYCGYIFSCKTEYVLPSMVYMSLFAYLFLFNSYNLMIFVSLSYIIRSLFSSASLKNKFIFFVVVYFLLHLLTTNLSSVNIALVSIFLSILGLFLAANQVNVTNKEKIGFSFLIAFFVSSVLGLFKDNTRLADLFENDEVFDTLRFSGLSYDPNFYTVIAIIAFLIVISNLRKGGAIIDYLLLLFIVFFGMQTLSKSFYLSIAVLFIYSFIISKKKLKYGLFVLIITVAVLPYLMDRVLPMLDIMSQRLDRSQDISSLTTGRSDLWSNYYNLIFSSSIDFLFGHGANMMKGMYAAHNTYLELIYKFGFIATLMDFYLVITCYRTIRNNIGKIQIESFVFIGIFVMMMFNLSAYTFPALWSCLLIVAIVSFSDVSKFKKS